MPLGNTRRPFVGEPVHQVVPVPATAVPPAPPSLVIEKYLRNAGEVLGAELAKKTSEMLLAIETLPSIHPLLDLLARRAR